ncbi:MAG TPA: hypothetical protein PLA27_10025 [Anaerolineales bacterium]|jgi:hypothetical protein|nr:hypothetical protein [Anaerolineales bacterium]
MVQPKLDSHVTPNARVEEIERGWRLSIPAGSANEYRNAQLDDYSQLARRRFPHRFTRRVSLLARASSDSIPGTWGFGLWNDPFGLSLGFGGNPFRLPALPNAVWFFGASKENYLSFSDFRPERSRRSLAAQTKGASSADFATNAQPSAQRGVANGFMAQSFRSPKFHPLLIPAGIALPFSLKITRRMLGNIIGEDGVAVSVDVAEWHRYSLTWEEKRVSLEVDNIQVFESAVSPNPPLGLVIWIDNQYASFTPDGKIGFGVLANSEPAFLEIRELEIG